MNEPELRAEINVPVSTEVLRLSDGRFVRRTTYQSGSVKDVMVWPGDHPNARAVKA